MEYVLDFLKGPFKGRSPQYLTRLGTCPVRYEGVEGWAETGDEGEVVVHPESLARGLPEQARRVRGLDVTAHVLAYTAGACGPSARVLGGGRWNDPGRPEREAHALLLHSTFGNPFRPVTPDQPGRRPRCWPWPKQPATSGSCPPAPWTPAGSRCWLHGRRHPEPLPPAGRPGEGLLGGRSAPGQGLAA